MARTDTLGHFLTDVANAIRTKKGTTDTIVASDFDTEIGSIKSSSYAPKYILFRDSTEKDLTDETLNLDTSNITNMYYMFYGCKALDTIDISNWNTSNVTNMSYMFANCTSSIIDNSLNFSNWNTSNVTNMSYMFYSCLGITSLDLSSFNTSNVTNMSAMFRNCPALTTLDIRNFDFSNCTSYGNMLHGVKENCLIIVKSETEKEFILTNVRSDLTNVKTVAEKEAEQNQ